MSAPDWNPDLYTRFAGLRLQPALDLLARVGALPPGPVCDLGCGTGVVGPVLRARWPDRALTGVDASPAMLEKAAQTGAYDDLTRADAALWDPATPPALIFSNALCHWLPDHANLFARLAGVLAPGGTLAVQMPRQFANPSHALMRDIAPRLFPDRFQFNDWQAPVATPVAYQRMLMPLGQALVWETEYIQRLDPVDHGHPVRHFTQSTALRPFAEKLSDPELARFIAAYEQALTDAYPIEPDGSVIFPFRRVFFTLTV